MTVKVSSHQVKSWFSHKYWLVDGKHDMSYIGLHLKATSLFIINWHPPDQKIVSLKV